MKSLLPCTRWAYTLFMPLFFFANSLWAQDANRPKSMEIYGFIMTDIGCNINQIHPDWFDVVRPTKLLLLKTGFGNRRKCIFLCSPDAPGFKNYFTTPMGELKTQFEFEMFGTGVDAGQTTIRLRHRVC